MNSHTSIAAICGVVFLVLYCTNFYQRILQFLWSWGSITVKVVLYVVAGLIAASVAVYHNKPEWTCRPKIKLEPLGQLLHKTKDKLNNYKFIPKKSIKHKALISRNVDDVIDELISLLLRDYVNCWYGYVVREPSVFSSNLKTIIRQMLFTFRNRCQEMDDVKFFTCDIVEIVNKHLQNVKNAAINPPDKVQPYKVYPFLEQKEDELNYLQKICEFLLITLLPANYAKCKPLRHLLREIFACSIFYNVVEKICDPDSLNIRLISWLKSQQDAAEKHGRRYAYAETYEDFIKMIQECGSVEGLQRWRYYIMTEIMQATTISKFKRSKGMDADKEFNTQKTNKGDLLQARNLSQYLNQLQFAKNLCEKRLKLLGGPDYISPSRGSEDLSLDDKLPVPCRKVLPMSVIMQSSLCKRHFSKFLQKEEMHSLLGFWEAVEEMKVADKSLWHQLGNDIVQMYVHNQASGVRLSKNTLKGIEEFMMANKGPEAFCQAQEEVYKYLEENFYASFIVSNIYHKMMSEAEKQGIDFTHSSDDEIEDYDDDDDDISNVQNVLEKSGESDISLFDHSSYARHQLKLTQWKLNDKIQALQAMRTNPKCDKKVTVKLDREIQDLCLEQSKLQNHIEKTELWIKYLGLWQATVVQAEVMKENDKTTPYFNVLVHLSNEASHPDSESVGWIVSRNLASFHSLQQKLIPAAVWLKKIELPTRPRFKSLDKAFLEKVKSSLQTFLSAVTKDDGLNKSEALYSFLSPSPEYMKHSWCSQKKSVKFNFFQFLKGVQSSFGQIDETEDEELLFLDDTDSKEDRKDSIAEPLYALIGEIFELKGVFNWLRRTLIIFVQLTYGKTINRQLRETVSYIVSEPMLLSYLQMFRDTMWPTSQVLHPSATPRTNSEMLQTKCLAKQMLINSTPEILNHLVGQQNAKKGVTKIFEALQDKTLNKQLLYNILEAFIYEYAPELRRHSSGCKPN